MRAPDWRDVRNKFQGCRMLSRVSILRVVCVAFVSISLAACSAGHGSGSAVPQERRPSFVTQPGNGGCTDPIGGCPIGWLCWDGSDPDPFYGSCPPVVPVVVLPPAPRLPCTLISSTVATTPVDHARTLLGVGEQVTLDSNAMSWVVNGSGTLNTTSGSEVIFTAGSVAGTASVTVSDAGCNSRTIAYTIIAPSGLIFQAVDGTEHETGTAFIGMHAKVYIQPDSVSFKAVGLREVDAFAVASGPYSCLNGNSHHPFPTAVFAADLVVPGLGTAMPPKDLIESGSCTGNQFEDGSVSFTIPIVYVVGTGAELPIKTVQQIATATAAGALSITKDAATRSTTISAPTSGF